MSLPLPLVLSAAVVFGASTLLLARTKTNGEGEGFALLGAFALFAGLVGFLLYAAQVYLRVLIDYSEQHLPWWLDVPLSGTVLGVAVYAGWQLWDGTRLAFWWACRRPDEDETLGFRFRRHLWAVVGLAAILTAITALDRVDGDGGQISALEWLVILLVISAYPLYQTWVMPWFLYSRGRTLDPLEHGEIHQWLDDIRKTHNVPKFHLRVQDGKMINALAIGGLRRYFIVLGRGLVETLSAEHIKAVLAHEIGHVVNRDTTWRAVPLILGSAALHVLYFHFVVFQQDSFWAELVCVAIGVPFFWIIFPGIFQRQWEYRADSKAVEIMGDAEVVGQSLVRLYDGLNVHIDAPGWPHPSLRARLRAIGSAAADDRPTPE